jgi:hypothetical protein
MSTILTDIDFWFGILGGICVIAIVGGLFVGYASAHDVGAFWED